MVLTYDPYLFISLTLLTTPQSWLTPCKHMIFLQKKHCKQWMWNKSAITEKNIPTPYTCPPSKPSLSYKEECKDDLSDDYVTKTWVSGLCWILNFKLGSSTGKGNIFFFWPKEVFLLRFLSWLLSQYCLFCIACSFYRNYSLYFMRTSKQMRERQSWFEPYQWPSLDPTKQWPLLNPSNDPHWILPITSLVSWRLHLVICLSCWIWINILHKSFK